MSQSDLNQPLHRAAKERSARRRRAVVAPAVIAAALVIAAIAAFWIAVVDDPEGGRAVAVATIEEALPPATGSLAAEGAAAPPGNADSDNADSGKTNAGETQLAALPIMPSPAGADPSLVEHSSFGPLPRVSPDGRRARDVYARRSGTVPAGTPRIVIVVGGLGLSQTSTQNALETLPDDVTLAFAPYGSSLQRWVTKAREEHREVILQVPMEPNNYPQENPGEHTLLVSGGIGNRDDLHWVLGRMTGYAGVMNHMGARFTADDTALLPFLGEIGERGLYYLDDGTSPRSQAATVGGALNVPVVTADLTLDRNRSAGDIEQQLKELETIARTRGLAVGVASAFPTSVETIARWVDDVESRGIVVVPASAALGS
jgi:polysaccharide deacetylase 2 family uncharacterized protein YibQ